MVKYTCRSYSTVLPGGVMATRFPLEEDSLGSSPSPATTLLELFIAIKTLGVEWFAPTPRA